MLRRGILWAIPILFLGVAYGAYVLARYGWNQVVEYISPFTTELPSGETRIGLSERVVIVLADGVRLDTSWRMSHLNELRKQGVDLVSRVGQPSLSLPGWTAVASGAFPEVSGVTTNWYEGSVEVDNIFRQAQLAGVKNALVGTPSWEQLFSPWIHRGVYLESDLEWQDVEGSQALDAQILEQALPVLAGDAQLVLIYFPGPDDNGHWFGGESPEYEAAVQRVDGYLAAIASSLNLESTSLIFTTDHGMTALGGHGGWEEEVLLTPLVMVGAGIGQGGEGVEVSQADIAPTVSALLGLPIPTHSQGQPLLDYLGSDERTLAQLGIDSAVRQAEFWRYYLGQIGDNSPLPAPAEIEGVESEMLAAGEFADSRQVSQEFIANMKQVVEEAREARLQGERLSRLPIALAIALLPLAYPIFYPRKKELVLPILVALLYFVVHYALFFGRGLSWSLSAFRHETQILDFINSRIIEAAILSLLAGMVVGLLKRRATPGEAASAAVNTSFFMVYGLVLQAVLFFYLWGLNFTWRLPDLMQGFKYYLDLFQLVGVAGTAVLLPLLALGSRWMARRVRPTN
ncbi:MAG: alkaline phosphatase family protein [Chloroflexi bacterium]|nr:alkaline phosphatase family protein [Chloroflexota bacterium]